MHKVAPIMHKISGTIQENLVKLLAFGKATGWQGTGWQRLFTPYPFLSFGE